MEHEPATRIEAGVPEEPVAFELQESDDEHRFMLRSPIEILYVLRSLARKHAVMKVHCGGGSADFLLTSLLEVDPKAGRFAFEASGSEPVNRRILAADRLSFFTSQDKVRIRFRTGRAQAATVEGRDAFSTELPPELLRLQRREYFRLVAPIAQPVTCKVPLPTANGVQHLDARVQDISLGGVGLALGVDGPGLEAGKAYPNCRIMLPDAGNVVATLAVRHAFAVELLNGKTSRRYGCMFSHPSGTAVALVQRYILKLERARKGND